MKKILVPTDFSDCSLKVLEYAASIARSLNAGIYLLHIIEADETAPVFSISNEWVMNDKNANKEVHQVMGLMENARQKMQEIKAEPWMEGIPLVENIEVGNTDNLITAAASRYAADMIILGTHGTSGTNDYFVGSNVGKILKFTDKPVLTIRNKPTKMPEKILFASDFNVESYLIFPFIKEFAGKFKSEIHLLKVITMDKFETTYETRKLLHRFINNHGLTNVSYSIYNDVLREKGIINFAKDFGADLIAIGTHGKHAINHLFAASTTEEIVNHAPCPVLTLNFHKN